MGSDEYERRYLGGDDAVYREKRVSRRTFAIVAAIAAVLGVFALLGLGAFVFGGDRQGLGGAVILGAISLASIVLALGTSVARVVVTSAELRFMVGLRRMSVPLAAITETSIGALDPATFRAAVAKDGAHIASVFDARDRFVRVAWHDAARGKPQVAWIGSDTPEALREAIDRARGAGAVRVASTDAAATSDEAEQPADERAAPEAGAARR